MEKLMNKRIIQFLDKNKLISKEQFGYQKNLSTIDLLYKVINSIIDAWEDHEEILAVLLDLTKAFDLVPHHLLIEKLQLYGIRGVVLELLTSYLSNRSQCVRIGKNVSEENLIKCGIPQGSVLGPLLFILFVNDLKSVYKVIPYVNKLYQFVDDSTTTVRNENIRLNVDKKLIIDPFNSWFRDNGLHLNEGKTNFIIFSLKNPTLNQNNEVRKDYNEVSSAKLLGLVFDYKLTWADHAAYLRNKLIAVTYMVLRLRDVVSQNILLNVYHATFESRLRYAIRLWGASSHVNQVFLIQKRVMRIICRSGHRDHCTPLFRKHKILTVFGLYVLETLKFVKRNQDLYSTRDTLHNYNTRNKSQITVPSRRLQKSLNSPVSMEIRLFNSLPEEIRSLTLNKFVKRLRDSLIEKPIYSISEFLSFDFI